MLLAQVDYVQSNLELRIGIGHWGLVFGILIGVFGLWIVDQRLVLGIGAQLSYLGIRIAYYDDWDQGLRLEFRDKNLGLNILIRNYELGLGRLEFGLESETDD